MGAPGRDAEITAMRRQHSTLQPAAGLIVFHTRLGLTMIDLIEGLGERASIIARLIDTVLAAGDGYAARDLLAHQACRAALTPAQQNTLSAAIETAGLGTGVIPEPLMSDLHAAVELSATRTAAHFGTRLRPAR
ncbi:hypothetical protein DP939_28115 [Spongiactinospora rosea]|uniref:Uncharacterized protein n=1 Tax=Spongiactinospora rosea TaxID=2248750 RepID=A0A366LSL2_9ACTN|nr:hypothetical protein [Spongiactinospora rosea]RBQ16926.1 hypothetical protein DP939_28115 [Spongiactinospora rosea]